MVPKATSLEIYRGIYYNIGIQEVHKARPCTALLLLRFWPTPEAHRLSLLLCKQTLLLGLFQQLLLEHNTLGASLGCLDLSLVRAVLIIGAEEVIKPTERCRVVVGERHMVEVVVVRTRPEG